MTTTTIFPIVAAISLPTVMYGGYALLGLVAKGDAVTPFKLQMFRAGHAHAGVLLVLALVCDVYLARTSFSEHARSIANIALGVGIGAQCGGFFVHMAKGAPGKPSFGFVLTRIGAVLLAGAMLALAYGLATA